MRPRENGLSGMMILADSFSENFKEPSKSGPMSQQVLKEFCFKQAQLFAGEAKALDETLEQPSVHNKLSGVSSTSVAANTNRGI